MFYIKKILLLTGKNTISSVDLSSGLNIIYGQSETGKSIVLDCIDYMFGAKKHRFDIKFQIKQITLILDADGKNITMRREIDSNEIEVSSEAEYIESGTYKIGKAKHWINSVWLRLMGITDDDVQIIMTNAGRCQSLTLRTFYHILLLDETRIMGTDSILANGNGKNGQVSTPILTSLMYMATGNNYLPEKKKQDPKIKKARKEAVEKFVDRSMAELETRTESELANFSSESPFELQQKIERLINQIGAAEDALDEATSKSQKLADEIYKIDEQIAECRMLQNRNANLLSQYESDVKRLTFLVEGDIHSNDVQALEYCPFCNGQLTKKQEESCVDAAVSEVEKIETQVKDLRSVQISIEEEIQDMSDERKKILEQRKQINATIRGELKPQIEQLRRHLAEYTLALNQYKAKEMISVFSDVLTSELKSAQKDDEAEFTFRASEKFREVFESLLDEELKGLLESCLYPNFVGTRFNIDDYDLVVNGHVKRSHGQGYRSFLNTLLAVAIHNCIKEYKLPLLVLDSPIMALNINEDEMGNESKDETTSRATETMKSALFKYFVEHQCDRQTIIIENDIPTLDYTGVNLIKFTKNLNEGRYGLISGYTD